MRFFLIVANRGHRGVLIPHAYMIDESSEFGGIAMVGTFNYPIKWPNNFDDKPVRFVACFINPLKDNCIYLRLVEHFINAIKEDPFFAEIISNNITNPETYAQLLYIYNCDVINSLGRMLLQMPDICLME